MSKLGVTGVTGVTGLPLVDLRFLMVFGPFCELFWKEKCIRVIIYQN